VASAVLNASRLIDCARGRSSGYSAHAFIANSEFTKKEHVQHGLAEGRIWVLHNPSEDLAALLEADATTQAARRKKITFVGSLLRAKGVYAVLDLAARMPDWDVQLIGAGPEEAGLRRQIAARRLRNVRLEGLLVGSAKAQAWHDSFVTVAPSLWDEPFGLVVPESYSLAIPVVSTGSGGMAEIIRDGTTGFVQSFRDPPATAALLRALWEDEARYAAMRRATRCLFEAEFTEQVFGDRLDLLQAQILEACREATDVQFRTPTV
jgi:Glycosyltransferase